MGFKRQMVNMMISGKSMAEIAEIVSEIMPELIAKLGPEGVVQIMIEIMPQIAEKVGPEGMARIMDSGISGMNAEQRKSVLIQYRSMLDNIETK